MSKVDRMFGIKRLISAMERFTNEAIIIYRNGGVHNSINIE